MSASASAPAPPRATHASPAHPSACPSLFHPAATGLHNLGNTCYANATYQCLLHTHALTCYMLRRTYDPYVTARAKVVDAARPQTLVQGKRVDLSLHPLTGTPSLLFMQTFAKFLEEVWKRHQQLAADHTSAAAHPQPHTAPLNPQDLFHVASQASLARTQAGEATTAFVLGKQCDLAEYLQFVLDLIHDTAQCSIRWTVSGRAIDRRDQMVVAAYKQLELHYGKQYSFITDMMTGQYFVQNQTCDNRMPSEHSETYDPFTLLTLDLPMGRKTCTLYDCFDLLIAPEVIDGWKGERSPDPRLIERKSYLWRLPNILIVHLKRFANHFVKNGCEVQISPELHLRNYCLGEDARQTHFELYAIANHEGTLQYGHYYADCKAPNGQWMRYNDAQVSPVDQRALRGDAAYVLFYRRIVSK